MTFLHESSTMNTWFIASSKKTRSHAHIFLVSKPYEKREKRQDPADLENQNSIDWRFRLFTSLVYLYNKIISRERNTDAHTFHWDLYIALNLVHRLCRVNSRDFVKHFFLAWNLSHFAKPSLVVSTKKIKCCNSTMSSATH